MTDQPTEDIPRTVGAPQRQKKSNNKRLYKRRFSDFLFGIFIGKLGIKLKYLYGTLIFQYYSFGRAGGSALLIIVQRLMNTLGLLCP